MKRTARGFLTRSLAAIALVAFYGFSMIGVSSFVGAPQAEARGRGGRGRGVRGRGLLWGAPALYGGYGYYGAGDRCYWSPRRGRWVCPYAYTPGYYRYYW
jgi:hypothetical protein